MANVGLRASWPTRKLTGYVCVQFWESVCGCVASLKVVVPQARAVRGSTPLAANC